MYHTVRRTDIERRLSPLAAEVYDAIKELHPGDGSLDAPLVNFTLFPLEFGVYTLNDDVSGMVMSTSRAGLLPQKYRRFSRAVGPYVNNLPKRTYQIALQAFIWGHECAHLVQEGPLHRSIYGALAPRQSDTGEGYLLSDEEMNADFIAVSALARTSFRTCCEIQGMHWDVADWRDWQAEQKRKYWQMQENAALI